jgi:hypothetical protein
MRLKRIIGSLAARHALACKTTKGIFKKYDPLLGGRELQNLKVSKTLTHQLLPFGIE